MFKIKISFSLLLIFCSSCTAWSEPSRDTIENAFESFFGIPFQQTVSYSEELKIVVDKVVHEPEVFPVKLQFNVKGIEKVLLLKLKNTGYYRSGYLNQKCADEPVFIASYQLNPDKHVKEIENRLHTHCDRHEITLLLWVRTKDGKIYSTNATFRTTVESPG